MEKQESNKLSEIVNEKYDDFKEVISPLQKIDSNSKHKTNEAESTIKSIEIQESGM